MTCDKCGKELAFGEWPFCGGRNNHGFPVQGIAVISDEFPEGPHFCETLGHEPVWVESKSQLRREAEARGLVNVVRHDDAYYKRKFRLHDQELRDTGTYREY